MYLFYIAFTESFTKSIKTNKPITKKKKDKCAERKK